MPRIAKLSRNAIAERLAGVFELNGYEGASLKMLADAVGLSKASLYHHFPGGKEDMAAHVLVGAGAHMQQLILSPLSSAEDAKARLYASLDGTLNYYSGDVPVCLMNSLLLGGGLTLFGAQIASSVAVWQKGLERAYQEAGADVGEAAPWAAYAVERIQGALVLCRVSQQRAQLEAAVGELKADVELLGE